MSTIVALLASVAELVPSAIVRAIIGFIGLGTIGALVLALVPPLATEWKEKRSEGSSGVEQTGSHNIGIQNNYYGAAAPPSHADLTDIENFLGGRDETRIRELFDLSNLLRYNILFVARDLQGRDKFPKTLSDEIDTYFKGGQGIVDKRFANLTVTPTKTVHVEWIPGKIGVINTSTKYIEARQKLARLLTSPHVPTPVLDALKDLDKTVEDDVILIIVVLNEKFANPSNFIYAEDQNYPGSMEP